MYRFRQIVFFGCCVLMISKVGNAQDVTPLDEPTGPESIVEKKSEVSPQAQDQLNTGKIHYENAERLFENEDYAGAYAEYESAYESLANRYAQFNGQNTSGPSS